ncbi:MAG: hypothetical protein FWE44_07300 [Defluviitaleaceae bacterium]|nr:hypothetical protein [Defluviitaleaceae bacterium]
MNCRGGNLPPAVADDLQNMFSQFEARRAVTNRPYNRPQPVLISTQTQHKFMENERID